MNRKQIIRRLIQIDKAHSVMDRVKMTGFVFWCLAVFSISFFGIVDMNTYVGIISTIVILASRGLSVLFGFWEKKLKI